MSWMCALHCGKGDQRRGSEQQPILAMRLLCGAHVMPPRHPITHRPRGFMSAVLGSGSLIPVALSLSCWTLLHAGLEHVAQMSQLTHLNLRDCRLLTNDGLRRLAPLKGLKSLALSNASGVTDKGLQCLAELTGW